MGGDITHTLKMAGYPDTLLKEYGHWFLMLRPQQPTLGAMLLVIRGDIRRMADIPAAGFTELHRIAGDIDRALQATIGYDKLNHIQLGMVDPQIHFHVLPRYETPREFEGGTFPDTHWPGPPQIGEALEISEAQFAALKETLKAAFP